MSETQELSTESEGFSGDFSICSQPFFRRHGRGSLGEPQNAAFTSSAALSFVPPPPPPPPRPCSLQGPPVQPQPAALSFVPPPPPSPPPCLLQGPPVEPQLAAFSFVPPPPPPPPCLLQGPPVEPQLAAFSFVPPPPPPPSFQCLLEQPQPAALSVVHPPSPFQDSLEQPQPAALSFVPPPLPPRSFQGSFGKPRPAALSFVPPPLPPRSFQGSFGKPRPAALHRMRAFLGSSWSDLALSSSSSGLQPVKQPEGPVSFSSVRVSTTCSSIDDESPSEKLEKGIHFKKRFVAVTRDSSSSDVSSQRSRVLADWVLSPKNKMLGQGEQAESRTLAGRIAGPERSGFGSSSDGSMAGFQSLKQDRPTTVGPPVLGRRAKHLSMSFKIALNSSAVEDLSVSESVPLSNRPAVLSEPWMMEDIPFRACSSTARHRGPRILRGVTAERRCLKWTNVFQMQHSEGFWELTTQLGELVNVDVDLFANEFLKGKGIQSLGVRAHADILRLLATLLVLQLMRVEKLEEGKLLRTLFSLDECPPPRPARWEEVQRAVHWVRWADRQYPSVYSRLEFGLSWETSTRQLLGFEGLPPFSALRGLKLQLVAL